MPQEIYVRPAKGQHVVINPEGSLKITSASRIAKDRLQARMIVEGTYVEPVEPPPVEPPPVEPPPTGAYTEMRPTDSLATFLAAGKTRIVCRGGVYNQALGSARRRDRVEIIPYAGEQVIWDGTGKDQHWVYLGDGADWVLGGVGMSWRNFSPDDSGVISPGDGTVFKLLAGSKAVGFGPQDLRRHFLYFAGVDGGKGAVGEIHQPDVTKFPGSALQAYRGQHRVNVYGGQLGGLYKSVLNYDAEMNFYGTRFVEPTAFHDVDTQSSSGGITNFLPDAAGQKCVGTGPNGAVRHIVHT